MLTTVILILLGGLVFIGGALFIAKYILSREMPAQMKAMSEQLVSMNREILAAKEKEASSELDHKKAMIEEMIKRIHEELKDNDNHLRDAEEKRIGSFSALKKEIEAQSRLTDQLRVTTESLSKVLSSNQMRGQWGEKVAADLLAMNGFVPGVNFEFNKEQDTGKRPDFTIFMPNKTKINVDAKFPYQNLKKMTETGDMAAKQELKKQFERDVREKIKQVTTRDYINPEENTVDFVILFIPNEMVFSFIYESMGDVWVEAMRQKVVLAGPFTFTALLRMVSQAYENFKYQKNVQKIIGHIKSFMTEFDKYNLEFEKIGERIDSLAKQYHAVETTRTNQLVRSVERIRLEEPEEVKTPLLD